jgi:hypothetical protein
MSLRTSEWVPDVSITEFCKREGVTVRIKRVQDIVTAIEENAKRKLRHEIP